MIDLSLQALAVQALALSLVLPIAALALLGMAMLFSHQPAERRVHQMLAVCMSTTVLLSTGLVLGLMTGLLDVVSLDLGTLVAVRGYHFDLSFQADLLGAIYLWLDMALCGLIGAFSAPYLHRDEGYHRFYLLLLAFSVGLAIIATGAGLDVIFAGWEVVGLSSALLIAYFVRRPAPVENGLKAYAVYRTTDVGLLLGVVALHHYSGGSSIESLATLAGPPAVIVGALLIFGAMGKGAIIPFTPWLPRAMEGPTPSSAVFYGALSIHASPFLLLRVAPLVEQSIWLQAMIVGLGTLTAVHATMVGRVQTDIKSSLGYASVAQVGVMWVWIGLGLYPVAIVHMVGHAVLRTWQLLRAPSLLHDRHRLVLNLGGDMSPTGRIWAWVTPLAFRRWAYRFALERWYLDDLWRVLIGGVMGALRLVDRLDRAWAGVLGEGASRKTQRAAGEPQHVRRS